MMPSAVFVPAVALQTKFSLYSKFSRNLGSMPKTSTYVLSTSRKHTSRFLVKIFGTCCWSTMVTGPPLTGRQVKSLWSWSEVCVRVCGVKSQLFTVGVALRQGCVLLPLLFTIYMNWMGSCSRVDEGATVGSWRINRLFFADGLLLLATSQQGLQHVFERFSAACDQAGMKVSTKKTRYYVSPETQSSVCCK